MQHDIDIGTVAEWRKRKVIDRDGEKIGRFEEIYLSGGAQRPEWAAVSTGLFGLKHSIVPLHDAQEVGDEIQVPLQAAQVKDAPRIDPDGELSPEEEERLYSHYGLQRTGAGSAGGGGDTGAGGGVGVGSGSGAQGREGGARSEGGGARDPGSERGAGASDQDPKRRVEQGEADREEEGGRTRRHVVTEEVHRNVRTEETESDR